MGEGTGSKARLKRIGRMGRQRKGRKKKIVSGFHRNSKICDPLTRKMEDV